MKRKLLIFFIIILIILIIFLLLATYAIFNWIENNDDFAPYSEKEFDTTYSISSDIFNLSQLKEETTDIAQKYEKNIKLTEVHYYLENISNGLITLKFYKNFPPKNKACTIEMKLDIMSKKIYNVLYIKGHGKRVSGFESEIVDSLNTNILSYLGNDTQKVHITVTNFGVSKHLLQ